MRNGHGLLLALAAMVVTGCGDDKKSSKELAQDDCHVFGQTWCERSMTCLVEVGTLAQSEYATNFDMCTDVATSKCDSAVAVTASYDQCLLDIDAMPCSTWNVPESDLSSVSIPENCNGAVLVQ